MNAKRAIHSILAAAVMLLVLVMPVAAGVTPCSLQATVFGGSATEVNVGEEVLIEGFDFAPGDVDITYSVDGTPLSTVTVTADGAGMFETTVTPQAGEEGLWTVEATDVAKVPCTATTSFLVLGVTPTATPTPAPTATPTPTPAPSQGQLPNVATEPPPAPPLWILGVAVIALSIVTLRQATNRRRV